MNKELCIRTKNCVYKQRTVYTNKELCIRTKNCVYEQRPVYEQRIMREKMSGPSEQFSHSASHFNFGPEACVRHTWWWSQAYTE